MMELVVLVDENNREIGTAAKDAVHTTATLLHRGFSVFLFNQNRELLLTQRSRWKKTFPGVWSNSVCGHPAPGETVTDAAKRRLNAELGIVPTDIKEVAPYRYRFADQNGIVENEICPILTAKSYAYPKPDLQEVENWKWLPWTVFLEEIKDSPNNYSPWCVEEARIIEKILRY